MKTKVLIMIALLFCSFFAKAQKNDLLPQQLRVQTHIQFQENILGKLNLSAEIEDLQNPKLFQKIITDVVEGKVISKDPSDANLYNYSGADLTALEVKERMGAGNDTIVIDDPNTGLLITKVFEKNIDANQIKSILTVDAWYFDADKMSFTKETIFYSPIRTYFRIDDVDHEDEKQKKVCILYFENLSKKEIKKSDKRLVHYAKVRYEQQIFNNEEYYNPSAKEAVSNIGHFENPYAPFLNSTNTLFLAESLVNKALENKIVVYDNNSTSILNKAEIYDRLGVSRNTILIQDIDSGKLVEKTIESEMDLTEIKSYIFNEDWYLDPISLRLVKKVRSIIPVRYYYKDDDIERENVMKKKVFEYKFTE